MSTCKWMRSTVLVSAVLLCLGIVTEVVVHVSPFETPSVTPALLSAVAAFSVFAAALSLAATFLVSLLPSVSRGLRECEH